MGREGRPGRTPPRTQGGGPTPPEHVANESNDGVQMYFVERLSFIESVRSTPEMKVWSDKLDLSFPQFFCLNYLLNSRSCLNIDRDIELEHGYYTPFFPLYPSLWVCPVWFILFKRSEPFYTLTYIRPLLYIYFVAFAVNYFDFMTAAAFPSLSPPLQLRPL